MIRLGMIGWRGMVGSVLMQRMREERDFEGVEPLFFSTSNAGGEAHVEARGERLKDANDLRELASCDVLMSSHVDDYTKAVYGPLRQSGWKGYWIDAASTLRMESDSPIILDPVNAEIVKEGLHRGIRTFVGGNCTTSLMLMAVGSLFKAGLVEWMTMMTYQAASGAGAAYMLELVGQMDQVTAPTRAHPSESALEVDRMMIEAQRSASLPTAQFGVPLAGSLIPWIAGEMPGGRTREEWKGMAETNKILALAPPVPVDGICVRVGTMRCHSSALTIKLTKDAEVGEIETILAGGNRWVRVVANTKEETIRRLTPTAVSGTLEVPVGRIHKLAMGPRFLGAFTVGDQLLWGAAEPLRRMYRIVREYLGT